jgi:hypothetical protein
MAASRTCRSAAAGRVEHEQGEWRLCGSDLRNPLISHTIHPGNACFRRLNPPFQRSFHGCNRLRAHAEHCVIPEASISRWRVPMTEVSLHFLDKLC